MTMVEAHLKHKLSEEDSWNQRMSWVTSHLINASGNVRKRISPTDIYTPIDIEEIFNPKPVQQPQTHVTKFESTQHKEEYLKELLNKFEREESE